MQRRLQAAEQAGNDRERPIRRVPDAPFPATLVAEVWENEIRKPFGDFVSISAGAVFF